MSPERQSKRAAAAASAWLARLESGAVSAADRQAHAEWLAASSVNREEYAAAQAVFRLAGRLDDPQLLALAEPARTHWWRRLAFLDVGPRSAWAGAFALTLCIALGGYWLALHPPAQTYGTRVGETRAVTLADGSVVTLNTDSVLRVPRWWLGTRRVALERGEAFFAVRRAPERPFVVAVQGATVRVLGTQFNVRLGDAGGTVAIVEGRVELSATAAGNGTVAGTGDVRQILVAGEAAEYDSDGVLKQQAPQVGRLTAWRSGQMVFQGTRLADLVREVNRYSRVEVKIADAALSEVRITGTFSTRRIPQLLQTLEKAAPIRVIARDDAILLVAR